MPTNINAGSVRTAAAIEIYSDYEQLTALAPTQSTTKSQEMPWGYYKLWVYSDQDIYYTWALTAAATDAIDTAKDLVIPARTLVVINVPWGKIYKPENNSLYFQCRSVDNVTADVRVARG